MLGLLQGVLNGSLVFGALEPSLGWRGLPFCTSAFEEEKIEVTLGLAKAAQGAVALPCHNKVFWRQTGLCWWRDNLPPCFF